MRPCRAVREPGKGSEPGTAHCTEGAPQGGCRGGAPPPEPPAGTPLGHQKYLLALLLKTLKSLICKEKRRNSDAETRARVSQRGLPRALPARTGLLRSFWTVLDEPLCHPQHMRQLPAPPRPPPTEGLIREPLQRAGDRRRGRAELPRGPQAGGVRRRQGLRAEHGGPTRDGAFACGGQAPICGPQELGAGSGGPGACRGPRPGEPRRRPTGRLARRHTARSRSGPGFTASARGGAPRTILQTRATEAQGNWATPPTATRHSWGSDLRAPTPTAGPSPSRRTPRPHYAVGTRAPRRRAA